MHKSNLQLITDSSSLFARSIGLAFFLVVDALPLIVLVADVLPLVERASDVVLASHCTIRPRSPTTGPVFFLVTDVPPLVIIVTKAPPLVVIVTKTLPLDLVADDQRLDSPSP